MEVSDQRNMTGDVTADDLAIYAQRRDRLRLLLRERNLDALLVSAPANRFYLSGFELHDPQPNESAGMLLITADGDDWLATDARYVLAARQLWDKDRVYLYSGGGAIGIGALLESCCAVCGIEATAVSWDFIRRLKTGAKILKADGLVESLRVKKDCHEIRALKTSFRLNHRMFDAIFARLAEFSAQGISEKELAWEIEKFFRENGAQELAFSTIAAFGGNGAKPHAVPGQAHLASGMPVLLDAGCRVDNYCSDQTRTWWAGAKPAPEFEKTLRLVREAQQAALDMMRPGVKCADVYAAARALFEKAGVAKAFNHGLGHGVGLETHEAPSLSPRSRDRLEKGMVVTVEPGLYYPEWGGARWEYTVLVEDDGVAIL